MTHAKALSALLVCLAVAPTASHAQSDAEHLLEAVFYGYDDNRDGVITLDEANRYIDKSFKEMDPKGSGKITREAFRSYSFGLADVAAEQGRSEKYEKAKDAVFKRWDRAHAGALTLEAYRRGVLGDAGAAVGAKAGDGDLRIDLHAFKRTPFVKTLMGSLR